MKLSQFLVRVFLFVACAALPQAALAYGYGDDGSCEPYPNIAVKVMPVFEEAKINTNTNLGMLQTLSRGDVNTIPHYEAVTLGLTRYSPLFQFYAPILKHLMPDGSYCARAQHLDARIGYKDVTVYVASEFPQGTCDFQVIMEHEQRHIEVNRRLLEEYAPMIQEKLAQNLKINGLFIVPNEAYAEKLLRDKVEAIVKEVSTQMFEENKKRQKLIDTPEEYAKNKTVCRGHIDRVMGEYFRRR